MNREFISAIDALVKEKEISKEVLLDAIESALSSAYKKHYGSNDNIRVDINRENGDISVYMRRRVVETLCEIVSDSTEIHIEDAKEIDEKYEAGDIVETVVKPKDFGRIAAQTAKQVVVQKIREAERELVFKDYINKVSELTTGIIQRVGNDTVYIDLNKTEGILSHAEQVPGEKYIINDRIKVYVMDVRNSGKGPQIFLSRSHPGFVKRLFELEVPEIFEGIVEIKSISREAGSRTKMAVYSSNPDIDAVGACVGPKGSRVQAVVDEIRGEKIDIILWNEDPAILIRSALSPAKTEKVIINQEEKIATAVVPDHQLSLSIGKEGQNVRLAARLTGWKIDIKSHSKYKVMLAEAGLEADEKVDVKVDSGLTENNAESLVEEQMEDNSEKLIEKSIESKTEDSAEEFAEDKSEGSDDEEAVKAEDSDDEEAAKAENSDDEEAAKVEGSDDEEAAKAENSDDEEAVKAENSDDEEAAKAEVKDFHAFI